MFNKKLAILVVLVMIAPIVLAACGPTPEPEVIVQTVVVEQTKVVEKEGEKVTIVETVPVEQTKIVKEEVVVEVTPTPVPVERNGGWLDTIIVVEEPSSEAAVSRIQAGEIDVYAYTVSDAELFATVAEDPNLAYTQSYGSYNELTLNPCGPVLTSTNTLNPFAIQEIREAMNWLVDRDYIVQEIMGGLAVPKFFPITAGFPDYARYVATARELEAKYAYDPEHARQVITEQMEANGAELVDGKWQYNGAPVTVIFLIRVEDERRDIGDYVSNQLEDMGFTVDRQYKTSAEASPLWVSGNPCDGQWHLYTGGWITTAISRDQGGNWLFFYSPRSAYGFAPLWQNYQISPEFDDALLKLNNNDFTSMDERAQLFQTAMELGLQNSNRVWLVDRKSFTPRAADVEVAADLAGAVAGGRLYPYTLRFKDQVGGSMTIAMPSILTEPINPWAGSNWIYDTAVQRPLADVGVMPDPYTGLFWPQRIESGEYIVQEGLPVDKTLDWVDLQFVPEIPVPDDALVDWDAENQVWLTAADVYTQPETALSKAVLHFGDLSNVTWHDGSPFDVADWMMTMIYQFDTAKEASAIYDESTVPSLQTFQSHFKGFKITSEDPFVVEWYDDAYQLDAEWGIANALTWPNYGYGEAAWHNMAVFGRSEAAQELAYSADKAEALDIERMNIIGGPSLEILKAQLDSAQEENYIPYEPTMSQYITADEATARYANLQEWYRRWGHFLIGTGPYRLEGVFPVEGTVLLGHNDNYPDSADKWSQFSEPMLADVEVDGPGQVSIGEEATFDVFVTFQGQPYAADLISEVKWLLYDATGALAATGLADNVEDGQYAITLSADQTGALEAGSNKIEVAVVSKVVSIPTFGTYEFVTAP
ncbi:MAG: ABC transporter substrate-binding protein [Anaerolineae bacterium]